MGFETPQFNKKEPTMEKVNINKDNSIHEDMNAMLDKAVASGERGHFSNGEVTLMGRLEKDGEVYKMVNVERYMNKGNRQWVQGGSAEEVKFRPEEVKALNTKHVGFYLEKK